MFSKCIAQSLFNIISSLISSVVQLVILKFKRLFGKRSLLSPFTGIVFPPQKASKTTILRVSVFRPLLYCSEWPFQATTRWKNPSWPSKGHYSSFSLSYWNVLEIGPPAIVLIIPPLSDWRV